MSSTEPTPTNGVPHDKGWPRRIIQAAAFLTGIIGVVADYGFQMMGKEHLPLVLYCMCFGVAWGLDPTLWVSGFLGKKP